MSNTRHAPNPPRPPASRQVDFDAARAARAEARAGLDPVTVVILGTEYRLPDELPLDALETFGVVLAGDIAKLGGAIEGLVGPEAAEKLANVEPPLSLEDAEFLCEGIMDAYGVERAPTSASGKR